jgi:hypothetical protein
MLIHVRGFQETKIRLKEIGEDMPMIAGNIEVAPEIWTVG